MNHLLYSAVFVAVLLSVQATPARAQTDALDESIQAILQDAVDARGIHGTAASIYLPDGSMRSYAYGEGHPGEPVDTSKTFFFWSFTKALTAILAMQLVEEGYFTLEDTVGALIEPVPNVPGDEQIKYLLRMRSKLGSYWPRAQEDGKLYPDSVFATREALSQFLSPPIANQSRNFYYHQANQQVVGLIAEELTGMSGYDIFRTRLFEPIGAHSAAVSPDSVDMNAVNGIWWDWGDGSGDFTWFNHTSMMSLMRYAGGAIGTTGDMLRVIVALHSGVYLSQESVDVLHAAANLSGNLGYGGYGLSRDFFSVFRAYGQMGGGDHFSRTFFDPVKRIGVSVAVNEDNDHVIQMNRQMFAAVGNWLVSSDRERSPSTPPALSLVAWPNPVSSSATFEARIDRPGHIRIAVVDMLGREVAIVVDDWHHGGMLRTNWTSTGLPAGMYIARMSSGSATVAAPFVILR